MADIYSNIASQLGTFAQPMNPLGGQEPTPPSKEQMEQIKTGMDEKGLNPDDHVDFSPEARARAMEFVQKGEESPQGDLQRPPEGEGSNPQQASTAGATGKTAGNAGEASATSENSDESTDIDDLKDEIEELEQEIRELQGKTNEGNKTKLGQKQQELSAKQIELAQLQDNEV